MTAYTWNSSSSRSKSSAARSTKGGHDRTERAAVDFVNPRRNVSAGTGCETAVPPTSHVVAVREAVSTRQPLLDRTPRPPCHRSARRRRYRMCVGARSVEHLTVDVDLHHTLHHRRRHAFLRSAWKYPVDANGPGEVMSAAPARPPGWVELSTLPARLEHTRPRARLSTSVSGLNDGRTPHCSWGSSPGGCMCCCPGSGFGGGPVT